MTDGGPCLLMIAGPNGAGKTTAAKALFPGYIPLHKFLNPDAIARQLQKDKIKNISAGRITLRLLRRFIDEGESFAFETTAAPRTLSTLLAAAKKKGYRLVMIYVWVPNPDFCADRVKCRVKQGGHDVPREVIERRFFAGLGNSVNLYLPLMDEAVFIDNASSGMPSGRIIAKKIGGKLQVSAPGAWRAIEQTAKEVACGIKGQGNRNFAQNRRRRESDRSPGY